MAKWALRRMQGNKARPIQKRGIGVAFRAWNGQERAKVNKIQHTGRIAAVTVAGAMAESG